MRTAIAALATLAMSTSAYAQKAEHYQIRHTADLVTVCSTAPSAPDYATAIAFCHGILAGAWGYYVASTAPLDREICSSDTTLTRQGGQRLRRVGQGAPAVHAEWRGRHAVPVRGRDLSVQAVTADI
jgi:hypothetical protein